MRLRQFCASLLLAGVAVGMGSGCGSVITMQSGKLPFPLNFPIPVPQVVGDNIQELKTKTYNEVPIMPPVRDYAPVFCMDPPSDYDVIRAMQKPSGKCGHIPFFYEQHYNDLEIVIEKLVDSLDECRFYPLVGPAQLHHCHYKATIYYNEISNSAWPFSWEVTEKQVEVIYMDKDHLHICTSPEQEQTPESYRDIYGTY